MVRTRIAPSPTGKFHIGNARAALVNYLIAKQGRGVFIVRIEDTDRVRSKKEFEEDTLESLTWLGLTWDEYVRQSERIDIYKGYIKRLLGTGNAFYCFHSSEKTQGKVHFCEYREQLLQELKVKSKKLKVIRFKTPRDREVVFEDRIRGEVKFQTNEIGDFSLAKIAEEPLYNLAVVVDDYEMGITDVIRGEDHISNTPKQIILQEALGFPRPRYAHLPIILGPDKAKLSKRHGATSVSEFRNQGYLPEALINVMAFLGWNPGDEREFFTIEELLKEFSLERVKKGGAVFNKTRLDFVNQHYLKTLSLDTIVEQVIPFCKELYGERGIKDKEALKKVIALERERAKTLRELASSLDYFFHLSSYNAGLLKWKNQSMREVKESLETSLQIIEKISSKEYNEKQIEHALLRAVKKGRGKGELLWPLRVALSGKKESPGPFELALALGKKEAVNRIRHAITTVSP